MGLQLTVNTIHTLDKTALAGGKLTNTTNSRKEDLAEES